MKLEDALTYLPATEDNFPARYEVEEANNDGEVVQTFKNMAYDKLCRYIDERAASDLPISLIDFAVAIIYNVGRKSALDETVRAMTRK
jgi:hypothetical protein